MSRALYPGSFDPFTNGHLSVLEKAVKIFDEVVICISTNPAKKRRFDECSAMYNILVMLDKKGYKDKVHVMISHDTIPARIARDLNCGYIIRGLRNDMDYNYEEGLAQFNNEYDPSIETVYFRADNAAISSTMVYSFIMNEVSVSKYLPYPSFSLILEKSRRREPSVSAYQDTELELCKQIDVVTKRIKEEMNWLSGSQESQA